MQEREAYETQDHTHDSMLDAVRGADAGGSVCRDNAKTTPAEPPGIWTDHAAAAFAGGSGTAEDPYQIATPQQMAKLAADINSGDESKKHSGSTSS